VKPLPDKNNPRSHAKASFMVWRNLMREGLRQLGVLGHFALEPGWDVPIPEEDWESLRGIAGGIDAGIEK
jgi:hypothetical protein